MDEYYDEDDNGCRDSWVGYGSGIAIGIAMGMFLFGSPKYEGQTAKEWYEEYADYEYMYEEAQANYEESQAKYVGLVDCINNYSYTYDVPASIVPILCL